MQILRTPFVRTPFPLPILFKTLRTEGKEDPYPNKSWRPNFGMFRQFSYQACENTSKLRLKQSDICESFRPSELSIKFNALAFVEEKHSVADRGGP